MRSQMKERRTEHVLISDQKGGKWNTKKIICMLFERTATPKESLILVIRHGYACRRKVNQPPERLRFVKGKCTPKYSCSFYEWVTVT